MPPCSGWILKSFTKRKNSWNLKQLLKREWNSYKKYKKFIKFPNTLKGDLNILIKNSQLTQTFIEYEWENKLRYVRIYFDTETIDLVTKDSAAKFVDMLSAIGGTMGLLTGFSIISAIEIVYFFAKFVQSLMKRCFQNKL